MEGKGAVVNRTQHVALLRKRVQRNPPHFPHNKKRGKKQSASRKLMIFLKINESPLMLIFRRMMLIFFELLRRPHGDSVVCSMAKKNSRQMTRNSDLLHIERIVT